MDFRSHAKLLSKETDLVQSLGGFYILDKRTRLCKVPFARSATVYEPQANGSLTGYTGSQVPWGAKGVRLDPSWKNFWLMREGRVSGSCSDGTITDVSGSLCTRFTPSAGAQSFPSVGRSPQTISVAQGGTVDIALSGYLYPSVAGTVTLEPYVVVEFNTIGASQIYVSLNIDPVTGNVKTKTLPSGVTEKSPLVVTQVGNGYRFEWVLTYTQDTALRDTVLVYTQVRTSAGSGTYTADGVAAIQYSHMSASLTSHIVPSTQAVSADLTVPAYTFSALMSTLGITLGSSYAIGVEYTSAKDGQDGKVVVGMSSGAFTESLYYTVGNSAQRQGFSMATGGAAQLEGMSTPELSSVLQRAALHVKTNNTTCVFNGNVVSNDVTCATPVGMTTLTIGKAPWGGNVNDMAGWVSGIFIIPTALTITTPQLQSLSYVDLITELGGKYLLDVNSRKCLVPFSRATTVYEPQPNGTYVAYSGTQVPWGANGVQLDGAWQNSCTWGCEISPARSWTVSTSTTAELNTGEILPPAQDVSYTRITTTGGATPHLYKTLTVVPSTTMQMSMLVRLGTMLANELKVAFYDATANSFIASEVSPSVSPTTTGWTRCDFAVTVPVGCTSVRFYPFRSTATLAAGKTMYLSLVNVTNTRYPVPLTKAETDPIDVASPSFAGTLAEAGIATVGSSYSMFAEYTMLTQSSYPANRTVVQLDANSSGNRSLLRWNNAAGSPRAYVVSGGTTQFTGSSSATEGTLVKHALRVAADIPMSSLNGVLTTITAPITIPTSPTHIRLGREILGSEPMGGVLKRAAIFPNTWLTDKQLIALGAA